MTTELPLQKALFPLDPWGGEAVFVVVDHPHPAIARAMVGPLLMGRDDHLDPSRLRCLALDSSRHFLFGAQAPSNLRANPEKFWAAVASQAGAASLGHGGNQSTPLAVTPKDSFKHWSGSNFWMPEAGAGRRLHKAVHALSKLMARHGGDDSLCGPEVDALRCEHLALARVSAQLTAALQCLLQAIAPELQAAYTRRPRLSTGMVNRLLALAQAEGLMASRHMLQAIQTESFGLLHLMAFDGGCPASREILQAVLSGTSLPAKFSELGVSRGVYRRTLFRPELSMLQRPQQSLDISSLHIPGAQWLAAMRLTQDQPIYSLGDWHALGHMLAQLQLLGLSDQSLNLAVMAYCVKGGHKTCGAALQRLCRNAHALMKGAQHIALTSLVFEDAIGIALEWETHRPVTPLGHSCCVDEHDWTDPAANLLVVCHVFGLEVHAVIQDALNIHPGIPKGLSVPAGLRLFPLDSVTLTFSHGNQVGNCLGDFCPVARYIADGVALYGVQHDGVAIGTVALKRDVDERDPKVEVLEISGRNNARVGYRLGHLAQSLADKWNADCDGEAWLRFSTKCRRLSPV